MIKSRIAEHKGAEAARKAAEQAQMEADAKAKAEREAQAKLDAEREQIRLEEEAKAKLKEEQRKAQIIENDKILKEREEQQETPTSVDKEVNITQPEAVALAHQVVESKEAVARAREVQPTFGEYEPLDLWPSDYDVSQSDELARVCQKLEEAEAYIQILTADKAA